MLFLDDIVKFIGNNHSLDLECFVFKKNRIEPYICEDLIDISNIYDTQSYIVIIFPFWILCL